MYLGIDVGGTKTILAALDDNGVIKERVKFPTPKKYVDFLAQLRENRQSFKHQKFKAGAIAIPATVLDRKRGVAIRFGNLPWKDVPIQQDIEMMFDCLIAVENDAKLGGLSESMLLKGKYSKVMYITVSTGIGISLIVDNVINRDVFDAGGRTMMFEHRGKMVSWESFASGRAIVERYGKRASDINDKATWSKITRDLAIGMIELIAVAQPDIIVIGGSVGTHFDKYGDLLKQNIKKYDLPLVTLPRIIGAKRAEDAVVYGCYDLAVQTFGKK